MIKCGRGRTFDAVQRETGDLWWDPDVTQLGLIGGPGCDQLYDDP